MPHPVVSKLPMAVSVMAGICEFMHLAQQAEYRIARRRAVAAGALTAFDRAYGGNACRLYYTGSDLPIQFGGDVWPLIWHAVQGTTLLIMILPNLPGRDLHKKVTKFVSIFGKGASTWYEGALQMIFGCSILSTPPAVLNLASRMIWWRWITGWILLGIGFVNILLGLIAKSDIRLWRHQQKAITEIKRDALKGKDKVANAIRAWREIEQLIGAAQYSGKFGECVDDIELTDARSIYVKWNAMRKAVKDSETELYDW